MKKYLKVKVHLDVKRKLAIKFNKSSQTIDNILSYDEQAKEWKNNFSQSQEIREKALEYQKELDEQNEKLVKVA